MHSTENFHICKCCFAGAHSVGLPGIDVDHSKQDSSTEACYNVYEKKYSTHKTDSKWIELLDNNPADCHNTLQYFARHKSENFGRAKGLNLRRITDGVPK